MTVAKSFRFLFGCQLSNPIDSKLSFCPTYVKPSLLSEATIVGQPPCRVSKGAHCCGETGPFGTTKAGKVSFAGLIPPCRAKSRRGHSCVTQSWTQTTMCLSPSRRAYPSLLPVHQKQRWSAAALPGSSTPANGRQPK